MITITDISGRPCVGRRLTLSAAAGVIAAAVGEFLGGWDGSIRTLLLFMCIDFLMGLLIAVFWGKSGKSPNGGLSSGACWKGIAKKVGTLFLVGAACGADRLIGISFARSAVITGFCVSELISICENAGVMGILPEPVKNTFDMILDVMKGDKSNGKNC